MEWGEFKSLKQVYSDNSKIENGINLELDSECDFNETLNFYNKLCTSYTTNIQNIFNILH